MNRMVWPGHTDAFGVWVSCEASGARRARVRVADIAGIADGERVTWIRLARVDE